ncbi:MAG: hypothetical protein GKR96_12385 [Gammaproteobacteria bacterium]|nr:hypothetical protein [Gammaproteobacteria bacterium]
MSRAYRIRLLLDKSDYYQAQGLVGEVEECLRQVLELDHTNLHAIRKLAELRSLKGQFGYAIALYRFLLVNGSSESESWLDDWKGLIGTNLKAGLLDESDQSVRKLTCSGVESHDVICEYVKMLRSGGYDERAQVWIQLLDRDRVAK